MAVLLRCLLSLERVPLACTCQQRCASVHNAIATAMPGSRDHHVFVSRLGAPGFDSLRAANHVMCHPELVEVLIAAMDSRIARVKFGASKVLRTLSGVAPALVYPHLGSFRRQLKHENSILRWNAMLVLANLAAVDREGKLDPVMDSYLAPISGPNLIDASNAIRGAAGMALAKPHLANMIARRILEVERASYATPECRNVVIGHAIRALDQFFTAIDDKRSVQRFIRRQVKNPRPATRSKAKSFLKKWPLQ